MAEEKRTTVIDFQIQEGDVLNSLSSTKKAIADTKEEQKKLNDAFKTGKKDVDDYYKETVQLDAQLKKQQASYSTLQKTVTGLKSPFDKLNDSIKQQAQNVTVAGVSLSAFANPATATIAVLGGLFKAYSSSTIGAKDLSFASNELSAAMNQVSNSIASVISSSQDGKGLFSQLSLGLIGGLFGAGAAYDAQAIAESSEKLEDFGRDELRIRSEINQRLEDNAEILAKVQDSQTSYQEKVHLTGEAIANLRKNEEDLIAIKEKQLEVLKFQLSMDKENEALQDSVLLKEQEISNAKRDTERKVQSIVKLESNLSDANSKSLENERLKTIELQTQEELYQQQQDIKAQQEKEKTTDEIVEGVNRVIEAQDAKAVADERDIDNAFKLSMALDKVGNETLELTKAQKTELAASKSFGQSIKDRINVLQGFGAMLQIVGGKSKELALTGIIIEKIAAISQIISATGIANAKAVAESPLTFGEPWVAVNTASAIFSITSAIAAASQAVADAGAAAGGGSFMTRGPQLLLVGDNPGGVERVDVTPVSGRGKTRVGKNMVAMAGGGTMYTDAAIAAGGHQSMQPQQQITVVMDYQEFTKFKGMVEYKDQLATA